MFVTIRRISVCFALAFVASEATASTTPFYGPKTFATEVGQPQVFLESVSVDAKASCEGKAAFILVVENSGVSSADIRLNGTPVLTENDFSQNRVLIEKPVSLHPENSLSVRFRSVRRTLGSPSTALSRGST